MECPIELTQKLEAIVQRLITAGKEPADEPNKLEFVSKNLSSLNSDEERATFRQALRYQLLADALVTDEKTTLFECEFNGYGDSGQMDDFSDNEMVDALFNNLTTHAVHFDWYNNEGGNVTMSWDVKTDELLISGYYNVVEQILAMDEVPV